MKLTKANFKKIFAGLSTGSISSTDALIELVKGESIKPNAALMIARTPDEDERVELTMREVNKLMKSPPIKITKEEFAQRLNEELIIDETEPYEFGVVKGKLVFGAQENIQSGRISDMFDTIIKTKAEAKKVLKQNNKNPAQTISNSKIAPHRAHQVKLEREAKLDDAASAIRQATR